MSAEKKQVRGYLDVTTFMSFSTSRGIISYPQLSRLRCMNHELTSKKEKNSNVDLEYKCKSLHSKSYCAEVHQ